MFEDLTHLLASDDVPLLPVRVRHAALHEGAVYGLSEQVWRRLSRRSKEKLREGAATISTIHELTPLRFVGVPIRRQAR